MKTTALILALFVPAVSLARDGCPSDACRWTTEDYVLQASVVTLQAVDWMQTRYALSHESSFGENMQVRENNPLLGRHPSRGQLAVYFLGCMAGHTVIAMFLPKPYRSIWQSFWVGVETHQTWRNMQVVGGLRLAFP
jgi:hypothetical protein